MRILTYANAPTAPTGFGTVIREIFTNLCAMGVVTPEDLAFHGVNYSGEPHDLPFKIWPAQIAASNDGDLFGRARFAHLVLSGAWQFDVLFLLEDHFTLSWNVPMPDGRFEPFIPGLLTRLRQQVKDGQRPPFKVVQYIPIDSETVRPEWITWMRDLVDYPVAYTEFGKRVMLDIDARLQDVMRVIPHGTTPETFFPIAEDERAQLRQQWFQMRADEPLIMNVNRNQPRKDIPRTLQVFREVLKAAPNAKLYLHMNPRDFAGFDLERVRHHLRIPQGKVIFPGGFSEGAGVPLHILNLIMNCADVMLTTARGEGWGLALPSDAMTIGKPVVAPDHTSFHEIMADGRGLLVPPAPDLHAITQDNDQLRPVADVKGMARAVVGLLRNPQLAAEMSQKARQWALNNTWKSHVVPQWASLLHEATAPPPLVTAERLQTPRRMILNADRGLQGEAAVG